MSEFLTYLQLGFHHVASIGALDHILFLCALAAVYRPRDWRAGLWVVTAFTVGHSLTLALVVTRLVELPARWIEFLIPVTIVLTCLANLADRRVDGAPPDRRRALAAVLFGLVHGAGFAGYLRAMFLDSIAVPLVGFNIGIEAGQILVLTLVCGLLALGDRVLGIGAREGLAAGFQRRVALVSGLAGVVAAGMALTRLPQ
jgi:hypothetical protein